MLAGAITVPVYPSNSASQVGYIVSHSEATVTFAENAEQAEKIIENRDQMPKLAKVIVLEPAGLQTDRFPPD